MCARRAHLGRSVPVLRVVRDGSIITFGGRIQRTASRASLLSSLVSERSRLIDIELGISPTVRDPIQPVARSYANATFGCSVEAFPIRERKFV